MARSSCVVVAALALCRAGRAQLDIGPIPQAIPIAGTSLCRIDGWEHAGRWDLPGNVSAAPSLVECASECEADPVCTGATYFGSDTVLNCWFKDWGAGSVAPPCLRNPQDPLEVQAIIDPAGVACSDITYMDIAVYVCDEELLIDEKPSGVAPGTESSNNVTSLSIFSKYDRFPGRDYNPGSPQSDFEDIGSRLRVDTILDCEAACDGMPVCNAVAFLSNPPFDMSGNCHLKTMDETCGLPEDANFSSIATLSLKCERDAASAARAPAEAGAAEGPSETTSSVAASSGTLTNTKTSAGATIVPLVGGIVAAAVFVLAAAVLLLARFFSSPKSSDHASSKGSLPYKDMDAIVARSPATPGHTTLPFVAPELHSTFNNDAFVPMEGEAMAEHQQLTDYRSSGPLHNHTGSSSSSSSNRSSSEGGMQSISLCNSKEKAASAVAATTVSMPTTDKNSAVAPDMELLQETSTWFNNPMCEAPEEAVAGLV